ncbi:MAG: hypothetical protein KBT19_01435 [Lachnospiraceae bacterium]|nr:hypothetical protein [Candidatus Colinaster equi]
MKKKIWGIIVFMAAVMLMSVPAFAVPADVPGVDIVFDIPYEGKAMPGDAHERVATPDYEVVNTYYYSFSGQTLELKKGNKGYCKMQVQATGGGTSFVDNPTVIVNGKTITKLSGAFDGNTDGFEFPNVNQQWINIYITFTVGGDEKPDPQPAPQPDPNLECREEEQKASVEEAKPEEEPEPQFAEEAYDPVVVANDKNQFTANNEGVVPNASYNFTEYVTPAGFASGVKKIADKKDALGNVYVFSNKALTINRTFLETLTEKNTKVVYFFEYQGHLYCVTILPNVNPDLVLDAMGHSGPLNVGAFLGTTILIR